MKKPILFASIIYFLISFFQCLPMFLDPLNTFFGSGGDMLGGLWWLNHGVNSFKGLDNYSHSNFLNAPFGLNLIGAGIFNYFSIVSNIIAYLFTEAFAINFFVFISFPLSGIFTYILISHIFEKSSLKNEKLIPFIGGLIYLFSTMHFAQSREHTTLASTYLIPFYIYIFLKYFETNKKVFGIILAFIFSWAFQETQYYAWFQVIFSLIYLFFIFWPNLKNERELFISYDLIKKIAFLGLFVFIFNLNFIIPQILTLINNLEYNSYRKPHPSLSIGFSPHFIEYFIPNPFHPLWGEYFTSFIKSQRPGLVMVEFPIFLGFTNIVLSIIALFYLIKNKVLLSNNYYKYFLILGIFAIICALPPYLNIFSLNIFSPSALISSMLPIRALTRYSILLMLSLSLFSSISLVLIFNKLTKIKYYIFIILCLLISFEGISDYKYLFKKHEFPEYTNYLKTFEKDSIIVEVPTLKDNEDGATKYKYFQLNHDLKLFNGPSIDGFKLWETLDDNKSKMNIGILGEIGVKYAVYHNQRPNIKNLKYLNLIKEYKDESIYLINTFKPCLNLKECFNRLVELEGK